MAKYSQRTIDDVNRNVDIRLIIDGADQSKSKQDIDCPFCGKKKKFSVTHNSKYNCAKCWSCGEGFSGPISALMHYKGYGKDQFPQAVEETAKIGGIYIRTEDDERGEAVKAATESLKSTFCQMQLYSSGLTEADVTLKINDGKSEYFESPFRKGRFSSDFRPDPMGDDMLIYYYDLHRRPVTYKAKGSSVPRQYVRARYANPDIHKSGDGKAMKYQTPPGAPSRAYIPEKIRQRFLSKTHIDTLFIQEGEKKAEKACKHGMLSIGIQGINNFGTAEEGLLQDIQDIATVCTVDNVVLMMDADWEDLHRDITLGDRVDKRPISFSSAVIKFRQFMRTLHNLKLDVEIWWGHVNHNEGNDKGVDDLLTHTLKCREEDLIEDIDITMNSHDGKGKYVDIHKITAISDAKIRDFWLLNDRQAFFNRHLDRLDSVGVFKIGGISYKVENGEMLPMSRYSSDVDIFSIELDSKDRKKVVLNYTETLKFLNAYGFCRMRNSDESASGFEFIRIDDGIIDKIAPFEVRDFICQYIATNTKDPLVHEYFNSKIDVVLPDKKLERLQIISDEFSKFERGLQRTYYNNGQVEITAESITPNKPILNIWRSRIVPRNFNRVPVIKSITRDVDGFHVEFTNDAHKCEFLQYLLNTSNNYYPHDAERDITREEQLEWVHHLVNKVTTVGYLLCDWKPANERKVVVVQDHLMTEVGQSHGGAGKSLIADAIGRIKSQVTIDGGNIQGTDQFLFSSVSKATRSILIDDVRPNFNLKDYFATITGNMSVNPKGKDRYNIPVDESPKIIITTNHTIKGSSESSIRRRISYMEFSNWYNADHSPVDDFHHMLFDDWDDYQWTLFDNLMAECVMYYLRSFSEVWGKEGQGHVPPPMEMIEKRSLRQEMSESLLQWAEERYDPSGSHLNEREKRNDLLKEFFEFAGNTGHGVTRTNFMMKIQAYCKFKGYDFNINKANAKGEFYNDWKPLHPNESFIGINDKSGGTEYFTVWSQEKRRSEIPGNSPF